MEKNIIEDSFIKQDNLISLLNKAKPITSIVQFLDTENCFSTHRIIIEQMSFSQNAIRVCPKIVCVGKNYLKTINNFGSQIPKEPFIFTKPWSSISYNPNKIELSLAKSHLILHQIQLGVYINKGGSKIAQKDAFDHVGGYFIGIDFTDRDLVIKQMKQGLPFCTFSKGQNNFCPISQLIPKQVNPYEIQLQIRVNEEIRQKDKAQNMHFKIDQLISYVSQFMKLQEGDLLLTGTPEGQGRVKGGDQIQAYGRYNGDVLAKLQFQVLDS